MATAPSPNDLTRQQLDELDALLQRMLTLPLSPTDEPAPAAAPVVADPLPVPNWRVDPPAPPPVPSPYLVAPPLPAEPPRPRMPEPEPFALPVQRVPVVESLPPPPPEPAVPVVERRPSPRPAPPAPAPAPVAPEAMLPIAEEEPDREPVPVALWPLVAFNWTVDTILGLFGPPGRLLRSGFGKNLLGLVGIALLALTAAHVATDRGWVALPFPVPWPR